MWLKSIIGKEFDDSFKERFWSKVNRGTGCWMWTAEVKWDGYGKYWSNGRAVQAHRFSWELGHGPIPKGMVVCHLCDVKGCVRPSHLFIGTQSDNIQDAVKKGRTRTVKLTIDQVKQIRVDSTSISEIARKYQMDPSTISRIKSRQRWKYIP